jgi:hypothetical protein
MDIVKWFRKQAAYLLVSASSVEKNILGQEGNPPDNNINQERRHMQGSVIDSLKQGEVTQEVKDKKILFIKTIYLSINSNYENRFNKYNRIYL